MNTLTLIIDNTREIYDVTEQLAECIATKIRLGVAIDRSKLLKSSAMARIIHMAKSKAKAYGDEFDKSDIAEAREIHTDYVLELANDFARSQKG